MRAALPLKPCACLLAGLLLILPGCTSPRISPDKSSPKGETHFEMVSSVGYDEYGRPVFGESLKRRPSEPGSLYIILERGQDGLARKSYLVAVTIPQGPDMREPLDVLYQWTARGFSRAGGLLRDIFTGEPKYEGSEEVAVFYLLVAATGVTFYAAGGIIAGVADGTWEAGREIGKLLARGEEVLASFSTYEYDGNGRILGFRTYVPGEPPEEMLTTLFAYPGGSGTPAETVLISLPDRTEQRLIHLHEEE